MAGTRTWGNRRRRPLRVEALERRTMLSAGPADWVAHLVSDNDGDLFTVDLHQEAADLDQAAVRYLGRMDQVMSDLAMSPGGELYGIGGEGRNELFRIGDFDYVGPAKTITTTSLGRVKMPGDVTVEISALGFRPDGELYAAGRDADGQGLIFQLDTETLQAGPPWGFGPYSSAGDLAFYPGVDTRSLYLTGIDTLLQLVMEAPFSEFCFYRSCDLGFADFDGLAYAPGSAMYGYRRDGEVYQIDEGGQTTFVAKLQQQHLDTILGATTVYQDAVDLGVVDFVQLADQSPAAGELWYQLKAKRDGILAAHAFEQRPDPGDGDFAIPGMRTFDLHLYEYGDLGELREVVAGGGGLKYYDAIEGGQYFLRVTNVLTEAVVSVANQLTVDYDAGTVDVYGLAGQDTLEFFGGKPSISYYQSANVVMLNGFYYAFDAAEISSVLIRDVGSVTLNGSDGDDTYRSRTGGFFDGEGPSLSGEWGKVALSGCRGIEVVGLGGQDTAYFADRPQSETFVASPDQATLTSSDRTETAVGFETVSLSTFWASIAVDLYDSANDDTLVADSQGADLSGQGYSIRVSGTGAKGLSRLKVHASGGFDTAELHDSPEDDTFTASPSSAEMSTYRTEYSLVGMTMTKSLFGVTVEATGFDSVRAVSRHGGSDKAELNDSPGDDLLVATPTYASLSGDGFEVQAADFGRVEVRATEGGFDAAKLYDSPGRDVFSSSSTRSRLAGGGFENEAHGFDAVHAYATAGGKDEARFSGSDGDDTFYADPTHAAMYRVGEFYNRAKFFKEVRAFGEAGSNDVAELHDSPGSDLFVATPTYASLSGDGLDVWVTDFESARAYASQGDADVAKLYDSPGNDLFVATPTYAGLSGGEFKAEAYGFDGVHAYATSGGFDVAKLFDSPGDDTFYADPTHGALYRPGEFYNRAKHFESVHAYATAGGIDKAQLFGSEGDDQFVGTPEDGALFGEGFYNRAKSFEEVYGEAGEGGEDEALLLDSQQIDFLTANRDGVLLRGPDSGSFRHFVAGFGYVEAVASTPGDSASVSTSKSIDYLLKLTGPWEVKEDRSKNIIL